MISVVVNGALGKMGREVVNAVLNQNDMEIFKELDKHNNLNDFLKDNKADVVVDFTSPENRMDICRAILNNGANGVIGTTGFTDDNLKELEKLCKKTGKGMIIAPNFTIGVVLMMHFAKIASKYFETAEIIEYHHNQKVDFPSGTAIKTAQLMGEARKDFNKVLNDKVVNIEGCRGGLVNGINIHSVRLPGLQAHQEVIFGEKGQYMTIRHDTNSREAYMPGVLLAIREVVKISRLVYGMEEILGIG